MALRFEWDAAKARANLAKHGLAFDDASTAFSDPLSFTIPDPAHSQYEERLVLIGHTLHNKLIVVVHTEVNGVVRIISARPATMKERMFYEENGK